MTANKKVHFNPNSHIIDKIEDSKNLIPQTPCGDVYVCVKPTHKIFSNQTGKFPYTSRAGYQYIMILYLVDANVILVEPTTKKMVKELGCAYQKLHDQITELGHPVKIHIINDEVMKSYRSKMRKKKSKYQLVKISIGASSQTQKE